MILTPSQNEKFDKAASYEEKAKAVFKKEIGVPIGLAYQKYVEEQNTSDLKRYAIKDIILFKFSQCKELYDKFLKNCHTFNNKNIQEKALVYYDFLLERIPQEWVQNECNYNNPRDIEEEDFEESSKLYNINEIDISTQKFTVQAVYKKVTYEEIDMNPDFQRSKVWTLKQKTLLIESLLINIPIPAFYIDARSSWKWNVIDGVQRLSTIIDFINNDFLLSDDLEYLDLKGRKFETLDRRYQRRIEDYELTFNMIKPGTPTDVAFNIFTRINTLGTPLSAQEIRHAMNMGTATDFLTDLASIHEFHIAISEKNYVALSKRMNEKALILRYLSFKLLGYCQKDATDEDGYGGKLKNDMNSFLVRGMQKLNKLDPKKNPDDKEFLDNLKNEFRENMIKVYMVFGENSFRKYFSIKSDRKAPINLPLFETITYTVSQYTVDELSTYKDDLYHEFLVLFNEKDTKENEVQGKFLDWISNATNNPDNVKKRFNKVKEIFQKVIGH
ncbi:DUF262 domain-containing protein [Sulfurospirillum sp. UCH001]|uniref:DUF262 domain-containing protein n=1 Tax=Sulfurospirillum sp. UCH001 TaxID=1581011 RepID=UPI00082FD061|nr:DUF262 domain-containing protein [Sulfurospirillum sp. UCH001]